MRRKLAKDPVRMARMQVQWTLVSELLAEYVNHSAKKWKVYEVHHLTEKARAGVLAAAEAGAADNVLWIYGMHAAGLPAAPHPKSSRARHDGSPEARSFAAAVPSASNVKYHPGKRTRQ